MSKREEMHNQSSVHHPYGWLDRPEPDFQVEYVLNISPRLQGVKPFQGMRCDFRYEGENVNYMIYPEILDDNGNIILDKETPIKNKGVANMWIFGDKKYHEERIKEGINGFWMIGSEILANVKIIKLFF